jgi:hypothetical protein
MLAAILLNSVEIMNTHSLRIPELTSPCREVPNAYRWTFASWKISDRASGVEPHGSS